MLITTQVFSVVRSRNVASITNPPHEDGEVENLNPFDPKRLRISRAFSEGPTVQKIVASVQVRKPNRQEYFRVHPDPEMRIDTLLLELRDDRQSYLISLDVAPAIPGEAVAKTLYTSVTRQGAILLWPVRLPDEQGRLDEWNTVAHEAARRAESNWIRLAANMGAGTYDVYEAIDQMAEPEWPNLPLHRLLEMAFKERFVDNLDHPVVRRIMGDF